MRAGPKPYAPGPQIRTRAVPVPEPKGSPPPHPPPPPLPNLAPRPPPPRRLRPAPAPNRSPRPRPAPAMHRALALPPAARGACCRLGGLPAGAGPGARPPRWLGTGMPGPMEAVKKAAGRVADCALGVPRAAQAEREAVQTWDEVPPGLADTVWGQPRQARPRRLGTVHC